MCRQVRGSERRRLFQLALAAAAGIALIEIVHTARILTTPIESRRVPHDYVSKGIWSGYAYIRPPDATSPDIAPTFRAGQHILHGRTQLYAEFDETGFGFVYPPTAAVLLLPLAWVGDHFGLPQAVRVMDVIGRVCAAATFAIALIFIRGVLGRWPEWLLALVVLLAFFPLRWGLVCVQAQTLINVVLAVAIISYARQREVLAGALLALACSIKPYLAPVVLFAVARGQWRMLAAFFGTAAAVVLLTVGLIGTTALTVYASEIAPRIGDGYALWGNQGMLAVARRWMGDSQEWLLIPVSDGVRAFWLGNVTVLLLLSACPRCRRAGTGRRPAAQSAGEQAAGANGLRLQRAADLGIALILITLASPIAWDHYFGWVIVLYCVCLAASSATRSTRLFHAALVLSYVLLATDWRPFTAQLSGPVTLVDSPKVFAALLLTGLAWHMCVQLRPARTWAVNRREDMNKLQRLKTQLLDFFR